MQAYSFEKKANNAYRYFVDEDAIEMMRSGGISRDLICLDSSDFEKFSAFCSVFSKIRHNQVREITFKRAERIGLGREYFDCESPDSERIWRYCTEIDFPEENRADRVIFLRDLKDFTRPNPHNVQKAYECIEKGQSDRAEYKNAERLIAVQEIRNAPDTELFVLLDNCRLSASIEMLEYLRPCRGLDNITLFGKTREDIYCVAELGRRFAISSGIYWSADMSGRIEHFAKFSPIGACRTLLTDKGADIKLEIFEKLMSDFMKI